MDNLPAGRILLRGPTPCPFGCTYCFANLLCFHDAKPNLDRIEARQAEILYPSCDTEVGLADHRIREIAELASISNAKAVSISTKRKLSGGFFAGLLELDKSLKSLGILLKVSVSISTKYQGNEIEKGASSYLERLETASTLRMHDIPSSVNLKPILPFIKTSEYLEIVDDFINTCDNFMLGGLYLSTDTPFGKSIVERYPHLISEKPVDWIPGKPIWTTCYDLKKVNTIIDYIRDRGGFGYLSDRDFVHDVLHHNQKVSHES